ncbi:DEAD/DEAH box helicase [Neptuniibacter marinus]|uniref:DEAD/DEAH box helicase n=1 Tax=Neptuniibacter marinus TaxID=1806670 RepID=UPI00082FD575|nr:DEAD/DEAH box helicase family protein [Neptuniibacter marinus]
MNLRRWQDECIKRALQSFYEQNHFLCLATPGAGKTIMSAVLSQRLLEQGRIDFVLCFSPSVVTSKGVKATFSRVLDRSFDGRIGAVGGSYTYQSMLFFHEDFWSILERHRVLVIFDEIHHCSGTDVGNANAWGEEILRQVREKAEFTLALTGTPWRSDSAPLVLSRYLEGNTQIHCDFVYGLKDAVAEGVCRIPKVVLVDNDGVAVSGQDSQTTSYNSLGDMLENEKLLSYKHILSDEDAIDDVLSRGCKRLNEVRRHNPRAGGLVVASCTEHAAYIHRLLVSRFKQTSVLVTYKEVNASQRIEQYTGSDTAWIVSVGMVSEGTDIPRLQVCCHLSRVRTELYFRQVLGRILRVDGESSQESWLYTFAEPKLVEFANRLDQELPDQRVVVRAIADIPSESRICQQAPDSNDVQSSPVGMEWSVSDEQDESYTLSQYLAQDGIEELQTFCFLGLFRESIVDAFDHEPPTSVS